MDTKQLATDIARVMELERIANDENEAPLTRTLRCIDLQRDGLALTDIIKRQGEVIRELERAAKKYFCLYMQDEAYSAHDCVDGERQHEAAKAVYNALALAAPLVGNAAPIHENQKPGGE